MDDRHTTADTADYVLTWKVADGWKISGAQAANLGFDAAASFDLAVATEYTSKGTKAAPSRPARRPSA